MDWIKTHRAALRKFFTGAVFIGLTLFIGISVNLYRQRKATEAMIAQRNAEAVRMEQEKHGTAGTEAGAGTDSRPGADTGELLNQNIVTWQGKTYRRNTYVKAILCMGVDRSDAMTESRELGAAGQADGIFLIAWDTARNSMKILMIPRDTMTGIRALNPDRSVRGIEIDHLTLAYAYGDGREESCENMRTAVSGLLEGLAIDHYLAADTCVIAELNDAAGGVTVTIPTDGMEKADPAFVKGNTVTLKGKQAERFVRYRDTERDHSALYRMDQGQEYITQFFQAVKETSRTNSQIVPQLFDQIRDYMVTDMSEDQYMKIALDALESAGLTAQDFYTLPGMGVVTEVYDEYHADRNGLVSVVLNLFYRET